MINPLERIPPHRVHSGFLPEDERAALLDWVLAHEASFGPAGLGRVGKIDLAMRNALHLRDKTIEMPWKRPLRERVRAGLPLWFEAFGLAPFEVSAIELDLIAYNHGAFYRRHSDIGRRSRGGADAGAPMPNSDRMITAVYYFNAEPRGFEGGALRLHPIAVPGEGLPRFVDIPPDQNSLAVFPSWAPHEVLAVDCPSAAFRDSRFAVNCWVRRAREG